MYFKYYYAHAQPLFGDVSVVVAVVVFLNFIQITATHSYFDIQVPVAVRRSKQKWRKRRRKKKHKKSLCFVLFFCTWAIAIRS